MTKADIEGHTLFPLTDLSGTDSIGPLSILENTPLGTLLDHVYFTQVAFDHNEFGYRANATLVIDQEVLIFPFGELIGLVLGGGNGLSTFNLTLNVLGIGDQINFQVGVVDVPVALRIREDILRPLLPDSNTLDPHANGVDISLGNVSLFFDPLIGFDVILNSIISLPRCMIAESGVIISASAIRWLTPYSDNLPANTPFDFIGLYLDDTTIELDNFSLENAPILKFDYAFIGRGGFTGKIEADNLGLRGSLFSFECELVRLKFTLTQGMLVSSDIYARLTLPFFDEPVGVEIGINFQGGFILALSATQPPGHNYTNGLITLNKPGLLSLTLESIRFALDQGVFSIALSGEITPDVGDLDWPTFRVEELSIDSQGNVRLEGGWLDLSEGYMLSFYGFQLEISKIGFGSTDDGQRWIGFSGGLKLVDGLTAGASVEGMRILWDPNKDILTDPSAISLTLNGVGVELDIPDVLYFKGWISMTQPAPGVFRFDGDITLSLKSLKLEIEAQLVIGYDSTAGYTFFAIYLGVELPAGIPLGNTSLAIYGMAGLFALNMVPGRRPEEAWYAIQPAASWYHKAPEVGVYHLRKWDPRAGSLAVGAGITIGTLADNGMTFNGRLLLVLSLPGPILMLEGRANILKERTSLRDEPIFRSLAVIDGQAGTFLVGLDAQYLYDESGSLIEIGGGTEVFFDFKNPEAWHLYLGIDEPRDRRIRAEIFQRLFDANGYFMINSSGLRTGAWIGYDKSWSFGPIHVSLQAWLEGAANLSFKPLYFSGTLWLHGAIEAKVFGFGFGLGADARVSAGVFDPFHIVAELSISLDLPWPFKDVSKTLILQWGPDPTPPLLPVPLKEVAIEHFKVTTAWPLPHVVSPALAAGGAAPLLLPTPDPDNDGFWAGASLTPPGAEIFPAQAPVVPLDARPHITFGRVVHDLAGVGVNPSPVHPGNQGWEWIGDRTRNEGPAKLKLSLVEVALERRTRGVWQTLANAGSGQAANSAKIFGSWAPVPHLPGGDPTTNTPASTANAKLWLWSRSPFDYTQRTGGEWEEWFTNRYPNYPCIVIPMDQEVCCDFSSLALGSSPVSPWSCPDQAQIIFGWHMTPAPLVVDVLSTAGTPTRGLCFAPGSETLVLFHRNVKRVRISVVPAEGDEKMTCIDFTGSQAGNIVNPIQQAGCNFEGRTFGGGSLATMQVSSSSTDQGSLLGLTVWGKIDIRLPQTTGSIEVTVSTHAGPVEAEIFDENGKTLGHVQQQLGQKMLETLRLAAPTDSHGIAFVQLRAPSTEAYLHRMCYRIARTFTISATAIDVARRPLKTYLANQGEIEIDVQGVRGVLVESQGGFCLTRVCVVEGLDDDERIEREEMQRSVIDGIAHWAADGELLPPWSQLRLKIVTSLQVETFPPLAPLHPAAITQYAYFRTEGPPGLAQLTLPIGHPLSGQTPAEGTDAPAFDSGLNDLTRYVTQTIPPTVPAQAGDKPLLPRPVYCAYDVGVKFNENYVDQMYASTGRDLSLYLFDNNDRPARDAYGRLLALPNRWGRQAVLSLSRSDERWLRHLDATTCATVDWSKIARNKNLQSSGQMLAADTLYEARLIPLLLHETFSGYGLGSVATALARLNGEPAGGWVAVDDGTTAGQWTVREEGNPPARYIEQGASVSRGNAARNSAFPGGAFLLVGAHPHLAETAADQPAHWTDYRVSLFVRSSVDNPVGMAVRWNNGAGYLFYLDRSLNHRRLVRVDAGGAVVLAESSGGFQPGLDSHLSFEVMGDRLRVFVDGEQVCEVQDATNASGGIGLFACDSPGVSFRDIRVDDLRASAPVVYSFKFTTSRFADFTHHVHSFRGAIFAAELPDLTNVPATVAAAIDLASSAAKMLPANTEVAAYETLAATAVGAARHKLTNALDVTWLEHNGQAIGLLIRTSEPIDWRRTTLTLSLATRSSLVAQPPIGPRLVATTFATDASPTPLDESVTVLLDDATNLTGCSIEQRMLPDATLNADPQWQSWYTFGREPLRAAGRRVRIFAGKANVDPLAVAGEDQRFGDAPHVGFQPTLSTAGIDMRLLAPDGRAIHLRRFRPDSAYSAINASMVRSADGTGLILLKPNGSVSGSQLSAAEYRLRWEYRLDNTVLEPSSSVLSYNGDTSPEVAQIDLSWPIHESADDHFYTISAAERDTAITNYGYTSEEVACYVFDQQAAGTVPLYHLLKIA